MERLHEMKMPWTADLSVHKRGIEILHLLCELQAVLQDLRLILRPGHSLQGVVLK